MQTVRGAKAPEWKWDRTNRIWYWHDARNGVYRGIDGTEFHDFALLDRPSTIGSPISPRSRSSASISQSSEASSTSSYLLQHRRGEDSGLVGSGFKQRHSRQAVENAYKVRPDPLKFFLTGTVFSVRHLYPIPSGTVSRNAGEAQSSRGVHGLVVIKAGLLSCSVVPIVAKLTTSDLEGHFEVGQHGIIYTGTVVPITSKAEAGMQRIPIKVLPDETGFTLKPSSRVNYGKVHNIEHSAKVRPFGRLAPESKTHFVSQFASVWSEQLGISLHSEDVSRRHGTLDDELASINPADENGVTWPHALDPVDVPDADNEDTMALPGDRCPPEIARDILTPVSVAEVVGETSDQSQGAWSQQKLIAEGLSVAALSNVTPAAQISGPATIDDLTPSSNAIAGRGDIIKQQAEVDRLAGRLRRFVGLHVEVLGQRHDFERTLDSAWESLAQCLQIIDSVVDARMQGSDAASEALEEAFNLARERVNLARSTQRESTSKQQELSTTETAIRGQTKVILEEWRLAKEQTLERVIDNSDSAASRTLPDPLFFQRPEVVAFMEVQQNISILNAQLTELEDEFETKHILHEVALDRSEPTDPQYPELLEEFISQKELLLRMLEVDVLSLEARRRECVAAGVVFQTEPTVASLDAWDTTSRRSDQLAHTYSIAEHKSVEELRVQGEQARAHVDDWVDRLPDFGRESS
ncbi:hypothetical protein LTR95_010919 [Oleoguttula sp. CCFEE 5521]